MIWIAIIIIIIIISVSSSVNAAIFGVEASICVPSWYCTAYDQGNCGNRTCYDVNVCGSNLNKPEEFLVCIPKSNGGNTGSESGVGENYLAAANKLPDGYFTVGADAIRLIIEQEKVTQKIITINSSVPKDYTLEIQYPSSYTKGTDIITTSSGNKHIDSIGDFNLIMDTRSILAGTYVIPVKIYNDEYSKIITIILDVVPDNNPKIELNIDSAIKTLGVDKDINLEFNIDKGGITSEDNVTYSILDPKGNIISTEEKSLNANSNIKEKIALPASIEEGYYTLSIKIDTASGTYVKSTSFTVLTPNKYSPVLESPKRTNFFSNIFFWIIVIVISIITLINTGLFYKSYKINRRHKYSRGITMFKFSLGKPNINISLGAGNGLKKLSEKFKNKDKELSADKKLALLKKSYDKGFISLKEYRDALKAQGFTVESNKVAEYYDEMKNKERVEGVSKTTSENTHAKENVDEERKEEQKKSELAIIKQEEELEKNRIESEKKEAEKETNKQQTSKVIMPEKETSEKANKNNLSEEDIKILSKIEVEQRLDAVEKPKTNPILNILARSMLDKKVNEDQAFVLNNNDRLYSLRDLLNVIPHMPEQVLHHHILYGRNDFANWIGDVFQYYDIAEEIRNVKSREEIIRILKQYE